MRILIDPPRLPLGFSQNTRRSRFCNRRRHTIPHRELAPAPPHVAVGVSPKAQRDIHPCNLYRKIGSASLFTSAACCAARIAEDFMGGGAEGAE